MARKDRVRLWGEPLGPHDKLPSFGKRFRDPRGDKAWLSLPQVYVLLFNKDSDNAAIYTLEITGKRLKQLKTIVVFEDAEDAQRYAGLLEAQDFPVPCVELQTPGEIVDFAKKSGYLTAFISKGTIFTPPGNICDDNCLTELESPSSQDEHSDTVEDDKATYMEDFNDDPLVTYGGEIVDPETPDYKERRQAYIAKLKRLEALGMAWKKLEEAGDNCYGGSCNDVRQQLENMWGK